MIIEDILNEVIAEILKYFYKKKEERIQRELEAQREREERERRQQELENREQLLSEMSNWKTANDIRKYVESASDIKGEDWSKWALNFANAIDPIKTK